MQSPALHGVQAGSPAAAEGEGAGVIYIGNVRMRPAGTRSDPWLFKTIAEARVFSAISEHHFWAVVMKDSALYRIYPGGRTEAYPAEIREKWAAKKRKKRGTGSGTQ
jgi:hypothetical protein